MKMIIIEYSCVNDGALVLDWIIVFVPEVSKTYTKVMGGSNGISMQSEDTMFNKALFSNTKTTKICLTYISITGFLLPWQIYSYGRHCIQENEEIKHVVDMNNCIRIVHC